MNKKSFKWNPNGICIFGSFTNPKSECLFDYWSIYHFYFTGFFYIIFYHFFKISKINLLIILTLLHILEDYFGNTSKISLEGIVIDYIGPIIDPQIDPSVRGIDNDYIENSIGDVLSGVISCLLIILYQFYYKKLQYFYLYGFIIIFDMLMTKSKILYKKK